MVKRPSMADAFQRLDRVTSQYNPKLIQGESSSEAINGPPGYWRNVPLSSEFYWFLLHELRLEEMAPNDFLLPRFWEWDKGGQATVLRGFCEANGLPSVKFHTLRACFATQLISSGVPGTVVMKICGWKDMKTMQRYIRLAGIDEAGATEVLRFIPTAEAAMERVVSLYDYRKKD